MMRTLGRGVSLLVTGIYIAGVSALIVTDLLGEHWIAALWEQIAPRFEQPFDLSELERARGFSFFTETPVPEIGLTVTTGVEFTTYQDLLAGEESHRWCYTILQRDGRIPRQVELGRQEHGKTPVYSDTASFLADELDVFGLDGGKLSAIARDACRFKDGGRSDERERIALGGAP